MRGSQSLRFLLCTRRGIIPAHAGLTQLKQTAESITRDHPRACGAHMSGDYNPLGEAGSSPRMRGSPQTDGVNGAPVGIIPAHAGLTTMKKLR